MLIYHCKLKNLHGQSALSQRLSAPWLIPARRRCCGSMLLPSQLSLYALASSLFLPCQYACFLILLHLFRHISFPFHHFVFRTSIVAPALILGTASVRACT
ncbi:hypothetical protein BU25DRAFT_179039 [Macroventuria anomochaeta]|uniref:Uncharacterized protein n=1 Tax=Macroventuria anomochaeta TaxID=301207 RepID=A0ACB6RR76_9PLEO|nr:uncharacterized protein BU25DRAFT_179039 [Macroventuria anomochaeta]KAF2623437.1 hypothetical protein BU25DRAFT_179039 [Macroventuria anomochaeta]